MNKNKLKFVGISLLILFMAIGAILFYQSYKSKIADKNALKKLNGEIVYTHRDGDISNIYKIDANGENKKILFHNTDSVNSNCVYPAWSDDGSKIYFYAMKNGEWRNFSINEDGSNVVVGSELASMPVSMPSRENDIFVNQADGSIYLKNMNNERVQIYSNKSSGFQKSVFLYEASWSPDKKFIIFVPGNDILVADKEGAKVLKITEGSNPDWKY